MQLWFCSQRKLESRKGEWSLRGYRSYLLKSSADHKGYRSYFLKIRMMLSCFPVNRPFVFSLDWLWGYFRQIMPLSLLANYSQTKYYSQTLFPFAEGLLWKANRDSDLDLRLVYDCSKGARPPLRKILLPKIIPFCRRPVLESAIVLFIRVSKLARKAIVQ